MSAIDPYLQRTRIAYLSMEIALRPEIHTYSGGLGILAGDVARSCADLELPAVFVTLVSRSGYLLQEIVLGIGSWRMLHALGFEIETYHLNEGHAALLALSLLRQHRRQPPSVSADPLRYDIDRVWERCVFTTHTPVAADTTASATRTSPVSWAARSSWTSSSCWPAPTAST